MGNSRYWQNIDFIVLLFAGFRVHHGDWNYSNVNSAFARLYYCDDGAGEIHMGDRHIAVRPGHFYLLPPYTTYSLTNNTIFSHYYAHVYENIPLGELSVFELFDIPIEIEATEKLIRAMKEVVRLNDRPIPGPLNNHLVYDNAQTTSYILAKNRDLPLDEVMETNGLLLVILAAFLKQGGQRNITTDDRVKMVISYIRRNLDKRIMTRDLADLCCLSEDHLSKLFKKEQGCLLSDYINMKKMEAARNLLAVKDMAVKNVAISLAFDNLSYFTRVFRKYVGMSPNEFKNWNRHN